MTIIRILLVPFFFTALVSYGNGNDQYRVAALVIFVAACITDALDGFIARITHTRTELGRFLDPLADKLLLLSGYLGLFFVKDLNLEPPLWVIVSIVFRDFVIVAGMITLFLVYGRLRVQPNFLGKTTTAFQMATLVSILLEFKYSPWFWNITAALTIFSCLCYIARELRLIRDEGKIS